MQLKTIRRESPGFMEQSRVEGETHNKQGNEIKYTVCWMVMSAMEKRQKRGIGNIKEGAILLLNTLIKHGLTEEVVSEQIPEELRQPSIWLFGGQLSSPREESVQSP